MELEGKLMTDNLAHLESGHYTARNEDGKLIRIERTKGKGWIVKTPTHHGWWEVVFYTEEGDQEGVTYEKETKVTEKEVEAAVHTIEKYCSQQGKCGKCYFTQNELKNCSVRELIWHSHKNK